MTCHTGNGNDMTYENFIEAIKLKDITMKKINLEKYIDFVGEDYDGKLNFNLPEADYKIANKENFKY
ncbi:hypothetical protein [Natranaerobius trueperi]|uniref:Uncharacterized protein n=1 Tax=Natranaerobius trueperi TaxID=759412 RepID=A0A226BW80_9FIRM|nr:hypothetical protein [Natranaerobius trueperi]OWZ83253.1 hypothetical protein CDO51_09760 [Natranaerobius trueperi]